MSDRGGMIKEKEISNTSFLLIMIHILSIPLVLSFIHQGWKRIESPAIYSSMSPLIPVLFTG